MFLEGMLILVGCRVNLIPTGRSASDLTVLGGVSSGRVMAARLMLAPWLSRWTSTVEIVSQWVLGNGSSRARYAGGAVIMPLSLIRKRAFVPK